MMSEDLVGVRTIRFRSLVCIALLALLTPTFVQAQSASPPASFAPEGAAPLPLAGQATRVHLLGTVELYSLAVYAEATMTDMPRLASPQTPKAIRIVVTYKNDLRRQVTIDWRRELIPPLDGRAITQLRSTFASLQEGDLVVIEYTPTKGTSIRVNKGTAVSGIEHDLMLAFLDHWLGQRPVSAEIKRELAGGS